MFYFRTKNPEHEQKTIICGDGTRRHRLCLQPQTLDLKPERHHPDCKGSGGHRPGRSSQQQRICRPGRNWRNDRGGIERKNDQAHRKPGNTDHGGHDGQGPRGRKCGAEGNCQKGKDEPPSGTSPGKAAGHSGYRINVRRSAEPCLCRVDGKGARAGGLAFFICWPERAQSSTEGICIQAPANAEGTPCPCAERAEKPKRSYKKERHGKIGVKDYFKSKVPQGALGFRAT